MVPVSQPTLKYFSCFKKKNERKKNWYENARDEKTRDETKWYENDLAEWFPVLSLRVVLRTLLIRIAENHYINNWLRPEFKNVGFLLALNMSKCDHLVEGKKEFITVSSQQTMEDVFDKYHPSLEADCRHGADKQFQVCFATV